MPAYLVVEVIYQDLAWTEAYRADVPAMIEAYGGRYLAKSTSPERLEGEGPMPQTVAIVEFPTMDAAKAMMRAPEYRPYAEARQRGARTVIYAIE